MAFVMTLAGARHRRIRQRPHPMVDCCILSPPLHLSLLCYLHFHFLAVAYYPIRGGAHCPPRMLCLFVLLNVDCGW